MTNPYIMPRGFQEAAIQSVNDQVSAARPQGHPAPRNPQKPLRAAF